MELKLVLTLMCLFSMGIKILGGNQSPFKKNAAAGELVSIIQASETSTRNNELTTQPTVPPMARC